MCSPNEPCQDKYMTSKSPRWSCRPTTAKTQPPCKQPFATLPVCWHGITERRLAQTGDVGPPTSLQEAAWVFWECARAHHPSCTHFCTELILDCLQPQIRFASLSAKGLSPHARRRAAIGVSVGPELFGGQHGGLSRQRRRGRRRSIHSPNAAKLAVTARFFWNTEDPLKEAPDRSSLPGVHIVPVTVWRGPDPPSRSDAPGPERESASQLREKTGLDGQPGDGQVWWRHGRATHRCR